MQILLVSWFSLVSSPTCCYLSINLQYINIPVLLLVSTSCDLLDFMLFIFLYQHLLLEFAPSRVLYFLLSPRGRIGSSVVSLHGLSC